MFWKHISVKFSSVPFDLKILQINANLDLQTIITDHFKKGILLRFQIMFAVTVFKTLVQQTKRVQ